MKERGRWMENSVASEATVRASGIEIAISSQVI